jgi:hypothetical protein
MKIAITVLASSTEVGILSLSPKAIAALWFARTGR